MRPSFRLVPDFIIPNLENGTYGDHLLWEDRPSGSFKISRIHQSSEHWNEQCIEVYKAWSIKKKLWNVSDHKKITKAKHRLITALRRNPDIEILRKESSYYRFRLRQSSADNRSASEEAPSGDIVFSTEMNGEETQKYPLSEVMENQEVMHDSLFSKEQTTFFSYHSSEANPNSVFKPMTQSENYIPKILPMPDSMLNDEDLTNDGRSTEICCCERFLDNYLCNQKCIWHGMMPP